MPYRDSSTNTEPPDLELEAIQRLHGRIRVVQLLITLPMILGGIALGVLAYAGLRDLQMARNGGHIVWVTAVVALVPTFGSAFALAPKVAKRLIGVMLPRWRRTLAEERGLDPALFEETTRFLG